MPKEIQFKTFEFGDVSLLKEKELWRLSNPQPSVLDLSEMIDQLMKGKIRYMVKSGKKSWHGEYGQAYAVFRDRSFLSPRLKSC